MENNEIRENIRKLRHGECFTIPESDYKSKHIFKKKSSLKK